MPNHSACSNHPSEEQIDDAIVFVKAIGAQLVRDRRNGHYYWVAPGTRRLACICAPSGETLWYRHSETLTFSTKTEVFNPPVEEVRYECTDGQHAVITSRRFDLGREVSL